MKVRLIQRVHATGLGRGHIDWYGSPVEEAASFPIMTASRRGVSYSPAIDPAWVPDDARELAEAVAAGLAAPGANVYVVLRRALRRSATGER